jgi:hypothetical protein
MQNQQTRILYRNPETGQVLAVPPDFRGTIPPIWKRIPGHVTGTWRKPGPVPVED